jgi:hypothetical protein
MKSETLPLGTFFEIDTLSLEQGKSLVSELKMKVQESPKIIEEAYEIFSGKVGDFYHASLIIDKETNLVYFSILQPNKR